MTVYGLTDSGFVAKPVEAIIADLQTRQKSTIKSPANFSRLS